MYSNTNGQGGPEQLPSETSEVPTARPPFLAALLERVPAGTNYQEVAQEAIRLSQDFRRQLAARLQPVLNAHIQAMPHDDLAGKKKVAEFINGELEPLGLAVRCPNTGLPAKLKATTGNWPGAGCFHFEVYIDGKRHRPTFSDTLPELQLMDAYPPLKKQDSHQSKSTCHRPARHLS